MNPPERSGQRQAIERGPGERPLVRQVEEGRESAGSATGFEPERAEQDAVRRDAVLRDQGGFETRSPGGVSAALGPACRFAGTNTRTYIERHVGHHRTSSFVGQKMVDDAVADGV